MINSTRHTGIAALLLVVSICRPGMGQPGSLEQKLRPLIESHAGQISVSIEHCRTGERFVHEADRVMPTASLIKFPLMVSAYGRIHRGELKRNERIRLRDDAKVPGSGILTDHFSDGAEFSLFDTIHLMIVYSDNTATNLVAELVGLKRMNEDMGSLGLDETQMNSLVYRRDLSIAPDRSERFGLGSTTANETVRLLLMMEKGQLFTKELCEEMKQHMLVCDDPTKIRRFLPPSVPVAHKSGEVSAARCEAGLIYGESGPIAICVLTAGNENREFNDDHPAHVLIGKIAYETWRHYNPSAPDLLPDDKLAIGSSGEDVAALQRTLNDRLVPSPQLSVDGDFGPATEAAVKRLQAKSGIPENGIVDSIVWNHLGKIVDQVAVPDPEVVNAEVLPRLEADHPNGPPAVSAAAWTVLDPLTGKMLGGSHETDLRPIASTVKIMTAYLVLKYAESHPEVLDEQVTFTKRAFETEGSAAQLRVGESVTVDELLYGLLLPSGNDAAVALAEHFGARIGSTDSTGQDTADPLILFVNAMNREASGMGLSSTRFTNPNGLPDPAAHSTASELARLSNVAWKNANFRRYTGTRQFGCVVTGSGGYKRNIKWKNTNQLLQMEGYNGIKTGTTSAAGACLVTHYEFQDKQRIVVVLGCPSTESRYVDTRNLIQWSLRNPEIRKGYPADNNGH